MWFDTCVGIIVHNKGITLNPMSVWFNCGKFLEETVSSFVMWLPMEFYVFEPLGLIYQSDSESNEWTDHHTTIWSNIIISLFVLLYLWLNTPFYITYLPNITVHISNISFFLFPTSWLICYFDYGFIRSYFKKKWKIYQFLFYSFFKFL